MRSILTPIFVALLSWSGVTAANESLEIGYMPIIPVSQAFILLEGDTLAKEGVAKAPPK
jgi:NitT/TauT family transport system substrate-binding protein